MDSVMNMFRFAARLLIAFALAVPAAHAQSIPTPQQYTTLPSIAALKATTSRPQVVQVTGTNAGTFNLNAGACAAADDLMQVQPTSGTTVCYVRAANVNQIGKSATNNGVLVTDGTGYSSISATLPSGLTVPSPAISGGTINNNTIGATTSQVGYFQPVYSMLNGYGNQGGGTAWQTQGHADWSVFQTSIPWNPTYLQAYSHAAMGIGQTQTGTNQVVRIRGTAFDPAWVGKNFFYWNGANYKVASVTDADHLTVQTTGGGAVVFPSTTNNTYYYVLTSTDSVVNTSGTAVTWVSGQPFISLGSTITINGVSYNVSSFNSATSITLGSSAGTQTGVAARQEYNDADVLSCLRTQGLAGADEEALSMCITPGEIHFASVIAGSGNYRPINFYNGGKVAMSITTAQDVLVTHDGTGNTAFGVQNTGVGGSLWYLVSKTSGDFSLFKSGGVGDALAIDKTTFEATFANVVGATGFKVGGVAGVTGTKTVRDAAGTGTCTLIFTSGLLTGGTC